MYRSISLLYLSSDLFFTFYICIYSVTGFSISLAFSENHMLSLFPLWIFAFWIIDFHLCLICFSFSRLWIGFLRFLPFILYQYVCLKAICLPLNTAWASSLKIFLKILLWKIVEIETNIKYSSRNKCAHLQIVKFLPIYPLSLISR